MNEPLFKFDFVAIDQQGQTVHDVVVAIDLRNAIELVEAQGLSVKSIRQRAVASEQDADDTGSAPSADSLTATSSADGVDSEASETPVCATAPDSVAETTLRREASDRTIADRESVADLSGDALRGRWLGVLAQAPGIVAGVRAYCLELPQGKRRRQLLRLADHLERAADPQSIMADRVVPTAWVPALCGAAAAHDLSTTLRGILLPIGESSELRQRRLWPYLLLLGGACLFLWILFAVQIAPTFREIYSGFGVQVPGATRWLLGASRQLTESRGLIVILPIGAMILLYVLSHKLLPLRWKLAAIDLVPLWRGTSRLTALANFAGALAELLEAGVATPVAVRIAGQQFTRIAWKQSALELATRLDAGGTAEAIQPSTPGLPATIHYALTLDHSHAATIRILRDLAWSYDRAARDRVGWLSCVFEPVAICLVGVIVGGSLVLLLLPILSLISHLT